MDHSKIIITWIDFAGGGIATVALAVAIYFGLIKADTAAGQLQQLRHRQVDMQAEHSQLQKMTERHLEEYRSLKEAARRDGKLDDQLPVHERIRAFRALVARHHWVGLQIMPLEWRSVADVAERSFKVTASCTYHGLLSFLDDFEHSSVWADVSHLKVEPLDITSLEQRQQCDIELTLNFYESWPPVEPEQL